MAVFLNKIWLILAQFRNLQNNIFCLKTINYRVIILLEN